MSRRLLTLVAVLTILFMVLPPLFNTFDTWDKTPELPVAGHDTETTLAVMALEAGMGLAVAWASVLLLNWLAKAPAVYMPEMPSEASRPGVRATEYLLLLFSPPWQATTLRI